MTEQFTIKNHYPMDDYIVGYELTWDEGTRILMTSLLWSALIFFIALII